MSALSRDSHAYTDTPPLERTIDLARINLEWLAWAGLLLLSILAHLWRLDVMALHHDESIHAWTSWRFFTGAGGFTCYNGRTWATYCYDPVFHGPSLYVLTLISYFLFGVGDWQARLPQAISGILLTASAWWLRPYLGRRGAFVAAVLLAFAPSILYYTRFARHDGLMILWTFWIVIGFFRYLDSGRARWLYLMSLGIGLAVATHELYYILFFIFGSFLLLRVLSEQLPRRPLVIGLMVLTLLSLVLEIWNPKLTANLEARGMAFLFMSVTLSGLLMIRVWDSSPFLSSRFIALWRDDRRTIWFAIGIVVAIYVLLYSTFFADPRGIVDGLYAGISYWLGSQQEYRRADQPWYYYFMLFPIYEPLGFVGGVAASIALFGRGAWTALRQRVGRRRAPATIEGEAAEPKETATPAARFAPVALFPLFLAFWFLTSLVAFSWAGEKMPWLLIHIALPANLLAAWGIGKLLRGVNWRAISARRAWLIPGLLLLLFVALGVALWQIGSGGEGQSGQASLVQSLIPLIIVGVLVYSILTLAQSVGYRITLTLGALTISALLGVYMIHSTWMLVYQHPDTPVEVLIYTQSAPDTRLISQDLHLMAINLTRNDRSAKDQAGGLSMPIIMDVGDDNGDGNLAWPMNWYFRDFQQIVNQRADFFRNATAESFLVDPPSGGEKVLAPAVLVYGPHVTQTTREALEQNYVLKYNSKLNWWFPEGDINRCNTQAPGYSRFYFAYPGGVQDAIARCPNIDPTTVPSLFDLLAWPFDTSHWPETIRYLLFRDLPADQRIDGREMQVWIRSDLAGGGTAQGTTESSPVVKLIADQAIAGSEGDLAEPRGIAIDAQGQLYVSDSVNHRVQVFSADGTLLRTIGSQGSGDGQFNEPRGLAVDSDGNLYVADTWNARIVKFGPDGTFLRSWGSGSQDLGSGRTATITDGTEAGNAAQPLGFFGPRGVAVDSDGNVYIADTGNKRIVVTDRDGNYRYQWGSAGAAAGQFNEPIGVAVDAQGQVYVADSWNSRVQIFPRSGDQVSPTPSSTWRVTGWLPNTYNDPFIAVGSNGQVYVTIPERNQVAYYNQAGQMLLRWGGEGTDLASVALPTGITVGADGRVYVVDRQNRRVLAFTLPAVAAPQE